LVDKQRTVAMGEVVATEADHLLVRLPENRAQSMRLLVRDAGRNANGDLVTITPPKTPSFRPGIWPAGSLSDPLTAGSGTAIHFGALTVTLVNGMFGDPIVTPFNSAAQSTVGHR
jgi:ribonuclease Z